MRGPDEARAAGLSPAAFYYRRRNPNARPELRRDHAGPAPLCECGERSVNPNAKRCWGCDLLKRKAASAAQLVERVATLHRFAEATGLVPTVLQAQDMLGVGRSRAGDIVLVAFGPDERDGVHRRQPRPFKGRA